MVNKLNNLFQGWVIGNNPVKVRGILHIASVQENSNREYPYLYDI